MRLQALKARPRRRRLPPDVGERQHAAVASNVLDRSFDAAVPNRKWIADFTYIWTAEGWLYVAAVVDLFSRRVVGWSMSAAMTAQLVTDALVMAIWRRASRMRCCITPIVAARADSIGRRNRGFIPLSKEPVENFGRCLPAKCSAGPRVHRVIDP